MKAKTELLLYQMLWGAETLLHPTYRNLDESFEGWAYRNGFLKQIHRLEAQGFIESRKGSLDTTRVHRLTQAGRMAALGGRDPEVAWSSPWDEKWRLFIFDIPEAERSMRRRLTRSLASLGCGCLQGSVWIAPTRPRGLERAFPERGTDCSHLMILEAASRGIRVDRRMVEAAWDFKQINERYRRHLSIVSSLPRNRSDDAAAALSAWANEENAAWLEAVRSDPLLPAALLPKSYLGRRAWSRRKTVLRQAATRAGKAMPAAMT